MVLVVSFPITDASNKHQVLRPVLVSAVKTNPSEPDIWDLRIRLCANGATQSVDLEHSYSPVCVADSLRIAITITTAFNLSLSSLCVVNAYQNVILTEEQMACIHPPPFCIEWFRSRHQSIYLPQKVKLVI